MPNPDQTVPMSQQAQTGLSPLDALLNQLKGLAVNNQSYPPIVRTNNEQYLNTNNPQLSVSSPYMPKSQSTNGEDLAEELGSTNMYNKVGDIFNKYVTQPIKSVPQTLQQGLGINGQQPPANSPIMTRPSTATPVPTPVPNYPPSAAGVPYNPPISNPGATIGAQSAGSNLADMLRAALGNPPTTIPVKPNDNYYGQPYAGPAEYNQINKETNQINTPAGLAQYIQDRNYFTNANIPNSEKQRNILIERGKEDADWIPPKNIDTVVNKLRAARNARTPYQANKD